MSEKLKKSYTFTGVFAVENRHYLCYNSDNLGIDYLCINIQKKVIFIKKKSKFPLFFAQTQQTVSGCERTVTEKGADK